MYSRFLLYILFMRYTGYPAKFIIELAVVLAQTYWPDKPHQPHHDIVRVICIAYGLQIIEMDWPENAYGTLVRLAGRWTILINRNIAPYYKDVTIAHELAHYLMHRNVPELTRRANSELIDIEARLFSQALLLPAFTQDMLKRYDIKRICQPKRTAERQF